MADTSTPTPSEPVSTASPAESPSSSAPASDSGPQDTRAIAAQVLAESAAAGTASPAVTPSTPPPTPVAARSDGEDDAEYQNLLASGSMPVDRHKAVLTNARNKARAEVEREVQAKYGWADTFDRARAEHGLGILNGLDKAPEQTLRHLAQILGVALPAPEAPKQKVPLTPSLTLDDGRKVWDADQVQQLLQDQAAQFDQRLADVDKRYRPWQEKAVLGELRVAANREAGDTLATCRSKWAHFGALENDIKAAMQADDTLDLRDAYIQVFATKGLPAIQSQFETDRASQLQRKAAASIPSPGVARPVTPQRDRDRPTRDIAREVLQAMS